MRHEVARDPEVLATADAGRRIEMLDILRGFALFGMILVHFHRRFRLTTDLESFIGEPYVGWIVWLGVEQKAWATFAFLFGVGFAIQMRRAEAREFLRNRSTKTLLLVAVIAAMASSAIALGLGIHELLTLGRAGADAAWQAHQNLAPAEAQAQSYWHVVAQRLANLPSHPGAHTCDRQAHQRESACHPSAREFVGRPPGRSTCRWR